MISHGADAELSVASDPGPELTGLSVAVGADVGALVIGSYQERGEDKRMSEVQPTRLLNEGCMDDD